MIRQGSRVEQLEEVGIDANGISRTIRVVCDVEGAPAEQPRPAKANV